MMMAIASSDEGRCPGTRRTRTRSGQGYAHMKRKDEPERIPSGSCMTEKGLRHLAGTSPAAPTAVRKCRLAVVQYGGLMEVTEGVARYFARERGGTIVTQARAPELASTFTGGVPFGSG